VSKLALPMSFCQFMFSSWTTDRLCVVWRGTGHQICGASN
jgi:hypothetical protein